MTATERATTAVTVQINDSDQTGGNPATIIVDVEGTDFGKFDEHHTPIISYFRRADEWMLAHKTPTGTNCLPLDVHGSDPDAITKAVAAAREHLHAHQTKAAVPEGSLMNRGGTASTRSHFRSEGRPRRKSALTPRAVPAPVPPHHSQASEGGGPDDD